jgi:hypothetical protein
LGGSLKHRGKRFSGPKDAIPIALILYKANFDPSAIEPITLPGEREGLIGIPRFCQIKERTRSAVATEQILPPSPMQATVMVHNEMKNGLCE